ncbi:MAG: hypothetical protein EA353_13925 [Puniceicoccaceae bacterium]|nr:MAG: hypothetical protein EA353_13925 [Puniceicoccaceae bacterium]
MRALIHLMIILVSTGYSAGALIIDNFREGGVEFTSANSLFALDGAGVIEVPFSVFTNATSFLPSEIVFSGARVEPNLRLELSR